jgi:hypothetical protein
LRSRSLDIDIFTDIGTDSGLSAYGSIADSVICPLGRRKKYFLSGIFLGIFSRFL